MLTRRRFGSLVARTVGSLALLAGAGLSGCKTAGELFGAIDKPAAKVTGARLSDLSLDGAALTFDVKISNPYAVPMPLANVDYALASGDKKMLAGKAALSGSVPSNSSTTVPIPVNVKFADVLRALSGVRPGAVVPYTADLNFSTDVPGIGPVSLPMNHAGELPVPAAPDISIDDVKWDKVSLSEVAGEVRLMVNNPNQFDIDVRKLGYAIKLGGREIASGKADDRVKLVAGKDAAITIPFSLSAKQAGLALFDMAKSVSASYDVRGDVELKTRFGDLSLPYAKSGSAKQSK